ncbi:SWPV1-080 [Shearwaterpox virus]|uniref:SWPV1-080 n=1 Tax=Shearwaterpox virus TaxID=1974596 RepID=A0A1V0S7T5_CNPV|nr:SWPV1-080 [Shearwaterpox virus]
MSYNYIIDYNNPTTINSILRYNTNDKYCYFGRCSDKLQYDLSYYKIFNPIEIDSIYSTFLKHYELVSIDERRLNTITVYHIMHHFIEFLKDLRKYITYSNISKRILLKDTGKGSRALPSDYVFL